MTAGPTVWRAKIHSLRGDFLSDAQRDDARAYCRQAGVRKLLEHPRGHIHAPGSHRPAFPGLKSVGY